MKEEKNCGYLVAPRFAALTIRISFDVYINTLAASGTLRPLLIVVCASLPIYSGARVLNTFCTSHCQF